MSELLSWFKLGDVRPDGSRFDTYSCSANTPEAIAKMRADGFVPMEERIAELVKEARA